MPWLYATMLLAAIGASVLMWVRARFAEDWALPHGIYASAQLVDAYHAYRREHGQWPAPGTFVAKETEYVRTFDQGTMRYDVFNFGGGQYVHLELHGNGTLLALPVKGDERRPGGAP
jgi:hypothetical protein